MVCVCGLSSGSTSGWPRVTDFVKPAERNRRNSAMRASLLRLGRRTGLVAAHVVGGLGVGALASHCDAPRDLNDCYDIGRTLGEGAFATVKLATSRATGESFALKLISKAQTRET